MAAKPESKAGDDSGGKKKGKGLLIGIILAVLLAGGGAGWYFTRPAAMDDDPLAWKPPKASEAVFMTLEPFTLNLADAGGERLIQVGISLELASAEIQSQINKNLPVIRNSLLLLISSQESKSLLTLEGKLALADEIAVRTGMSLGWHPGDPEPVSATGDGSASARMVASRRTAPRPAPRPNPVLGVHFAQFLIQ